MSIMEDEGDDLQQERNEENKNARSDSKNNSRGKNYPKIAINLENEIAKF